MKYVLRNLSAIVLLFDLECILGAYIYIAFEHRALTGEGVLTGIHTWCLWAAERIALRTMIWNYLLHS